MTEQYECDQSSARADWREFAALEADQAPPPPASLLQVVGKAAGGLPKGVTPRAALRASAELLTLLKGSKQ